MAVTVIVDPTAAVEGTVTVTWAIPVLSVKAMLELRSAEGKVVAEPPGAVRLAAKSICTFGRAETELSCTKKLTWSPGLAVVVPDAGEVHVNVSLGRAVFMPLASTANVAAGLVIEEFRTKSE